MLQLAAGHERSPGVQVSGTREEVPRNKPEIGHGNFHMENDDEPADLGYMVFRPNAYDWIRFPS